MFKAHCRGQSHKSLANWGRQAWNTGVEPIPDAQALWEEHLPIKIVTTLQVISELMAKLQPVKESWDHRSCISKANFTQPLRGRRPLCIKALLTTNKIAVLSMEQSPTPLLTVVFLRNSSTATLRPRRLSSLAVLGFCSGSLKYWAAVPSYLLPYVPDIFMAHCVQSSFLDSVQAHRPRWRRWGRLTFYCGLIISYLFFRSWRLKENQKLRNAETNASRNTEKNKSIL